MKTKVLAIFLCSAVCVCGFTGCSNETQDTPDNTQSTTQEQTETTETTAIKTNPMVRRIFTILFNFSHASYLPVFHAVLATIVRYSGTNP